MRSLIFSAFLLIIIAPPTWAICSGLFSQPEKLGQALNEARVSCYDISRCQNNVARFLEKIKQLPSGDQFLEQSRVLFLFDRNYEMIRPQKGLIDSGKSWRFHVIADTPQGIIELEPRYTSVLSAEDYFKIYFPKSFSDTSDLLVDSIPALEYLERRRNKSYEALDFRVTCRGWLKHIALSDRTCIEGEPMTLKLAPWEPLYFIASEKRLKEAKPYRVSDYLKRQTLAK